MYWNPDDQCDDFNDVEDTNDWYDDPAQDDEDNFVGDDGAFDLGDGASIEADVIDVDAIDGPSDSNANDVGDSDDFISLPSTGESTQVYNIL